MSYDHGLIERVSCSFARSVDGGLLEAMERRNGAHPEKLKHRKGIVEHPFGKIKRSTNQGYFPVCRQAG
ncbi:MAG: hypothetical protein ABSF61_13660 [Anaerolineales bacterium]|jgi:hypothetical protein